MIYIMIICRIFSLMTFYSANEFESEIFNILYRINIHNVRNLICNVLQMFAIHSKFFKRKYLSIHFNNYVPHVLIFVYFFFYF